LNFIDQLE
jgi:hypothetical protein